jgi:hypothetical protein
MDVEHGGRRGVLIYVTRELISVRIRQMYETCPVKELFVLFEGKL